MARQLKPDTQLARLILGSGKPAYVVAGEVGINYNRLLDYADGRMAIGVNHRQKLEQYFGGNVDGSAALAVGHVPVETSFTAVAKTAKVTPGGDGTVVLFVDRQLRELGKAWRLAAARRGEFSVTVYDPIADEPYEMRATVTNLRVKPGWGIEIALRVPPEDRSAVLALGLIELPKVFYFSER